MAASAKANPFESLNEAIRILRRNNKLTEEGGIWKNFSFKKKENSKNFTVQLLGKDKKPREDKRVNFDMLLKNVQEAFLEKEETPVETDSLTDTLLKLAMEAKKMESENDSLKKELHALKCENGKLKAVISKQKKELSEMTTKLAGNPEL